MISIGPLLWTISKGDISWLLLSLILWTLGSMVIFYPFMEHVYPYMLTNTGIFLLTAILIIIGAWFNMTLITFFLPHKYIYLTVINTTLHQLSLFSGLYVFLLSTLFSKLNSFYPIKDNS
jgi:hypothetical protein